MITEENTITLRNDHVAFEEEEHAMFVDYFFIRLLVFFCKRLLVLFHTHTHNEKNQNLDAHSQSHTYRKIFLFLLLIKNYNENRKKSQRNWCSCHWNQIPEEK